LGEQGRSTRRWFLLAILPLATGAALLAHVLVHVSLGLALLVAGAIILLVGIFTWGSLAPTAQAEFTRRIKAGLLAGLLALLAYDFLRWVIVTVFHYTFWPFDVFPIFGYAIAGPNLTPGLATAIGLLYHCTNGVFFAVAYAILFAPRNWWIGILWALGLEALMLSIYPGWLHIQAFNEFLSVSMLGHLAYGTVLGTTSHWSWARLKSHALRKSESMSTSLKN
jgi:hypothetical protein